MEYIFFGQLNPVFKRISFDIKNPPLRLTIDSSAGKFDYTLHLNDSADVVVVVETEREIADIITLMNLVRFFTQSFYDTALLLSGVACSINFTSAYLPNKSLVHINTQDVSSWLPTNIFDFQTEELFELKNDPIVRVAITDIRHACTEPDLTALFSFRAIEGIMNSFGENQKDDRKNNWLLLRENLNITRELIEPVTELSKSNRHGKPLEQSMSDRQLCIQTAIIILQRYLHYLKEGRIKLDIQRFPEIDSINKLQKAY